MRPVFRNVPLGPVDKDTDPRFIRENMLVDSVNMISGYGTGREGARVPYESIRESTGSPLLNAGAKCIGAEPDERNGTVIYFVYSTDGEHSIWRYYVEDEFHAPLTSGSFLNFRGNWYVQARIVDGDKLYFTDGTSNKQDIEGNPPRMLNLAKADYTGKNMEYELLIDGSFPNPVRYRIDFYDRFYTPTGDFADILISVPVGDKEAGLAAITAWLNALPTPTQVTATTDGKSIMMSVDSQEIRAVVTSTQSGVPSENIEDVLTVPENHYTFDALTPAPSPDGTINDLDRSFLISREKYQPRTAPVAVYETDVNYTSNFVDRIMPQFTWRYIYDNGEKSKWGPYSHITIPLADNNRIKVTLDSRWVGNGSNSSAALGIIKGVDLAVRYGTDEPFRLVKTLRRSDLSLLGENTFYFYNDSEYPLVPSDEDGGTAELQVLGAFDEIPDISGTMEAVSDEDGATRIVDGAVKLGFDPVMPDVSFSSVTASAALRYAVYKKNSRFAFGMTYSKPGGKRSAVMPIGIFETPGWDVDGYVPKTVRLELNHLPPPEETGIFQYHIVRKKNLSYLRWKPLLMQTADDEVVAPVKYGILTTGEDSFISQGYANPTNTHAAFRCVAPWFDEDATNIITQYRNEAANWFFQPTAGDRIRLILNYGADFNTVAGLDDDYEVEGFEYETIPTLSAFNARYIWIYVKIDGVPNYFSSSEQNFVAELYTPRTADDGLYYEVYSNFILNGFHLGEVQNQTAVQPAIIDLDRSGDAYWRPNVHPEFPEVTFPGFNLTALESENIYTFKESKNESIGKPTAEDPTQKLTFYPDRFYISDIYIQGSSTNGLSSVRLNNYKQLNHEYGILKKLQMSGEVLLGICEFRVQPIYVGKNRFLDVSGDSTIGRSTELFNLGDPLKERAGTKHPMSVVNALGNTYFYDIYQGKWWRYNKGLHPISDYGYAERFLTWAKNTGYDIPQDAWVPGGYDPKFKMPLVTLVDGNIRSPKTLGFSEEEGNKGFQGEFEFHPELYCTLGQVMLSFVDGKVYHHNDAGTYCNFYGTQYTPSFTVSVNPSPSEMKHFWNARVTSPAMKLISPDDDSIIIPASDQYPDGMASRLKSGKWALYESKWYADFMRDMNDTAEPFASIVDANDRKLAALISGRFLRGEYLLIKLQPETEGPDFAVYEVAVEYTASKPVKQ